jgi:hypothetical protein
LTDSYEQTSGPVFDDGKREAKNPRSSLKRTARKTVNLSVKTAKHNKKRGYKNVRGKPIEKNARKQQKNINNNKQHMSEHFEMRTKCVCGKEAKR